MAEHLSPLDATFLELEQADQGAHMHIGGVMVFEPRSDGTPSVDQVRSILGARLRELPRYGQRLSAPATGGLSWPSWVEDPDFDLSRHVRRETVPAPGGDPELLEWAGRFYSERLDRARPLWELIVLNGLADGRWALATKTHHCMIDGVGSVDAATVMLDAEPHPRKRQAPEPLAAESVEDEEADGADAGSALGGLVQIPFRVAGAAARLAAGGAHAVTHPAEAREALGKARAMVELIVRDEVMAAPRSSLNVPIGGQRRLAVARVPLTELKAIKKGLGGTVNDVVLAATAGGLRELLLERGEPTPAEGLRAMVPVNIRTAGEHLALGNKITSLFVHLPVAEADPLQRYRRQTEEAESLKSGTQAVGSRTLIDLASLAPPALHSFIAQSLFATRLFNVTVTNVPGPQQPLYAFGSRMEAVWPIVPLAAEHCVGLAVFSYDGDLFFTLNADRDTVPDLDVLAAGIETAIAQLRELCSTPP
jgi:WS/DGAT/MGAT family acyltransferase